MPSHYGKKTATKKMGMTIKTAKKPSKKKK